MKRIVMGNHPPSGLRGLFISKPGKSADSALHDDYMIYPGYNPMVVLSTGVAGSLSLISATDTGVTGWDTLNNFYGRLWDVVFGAAYTHGLGYTPIIWADPVFGLQAANPAHYTYVTGGNTYSGQGYQNCPLFAASNGTIAGICAIGKVVVGQTQIRQGSTAPVVGNFALSSSLTISDAILTPKYVHYAVYTGAVA